MTCTHPAAHTAKTVLILAFFGIASIVLAGPVLAFLGVALAAATVVGVFAIIGLIFWSLILVMVRGPQVAWMSLRTLITPIGHTALAAAKGTKAVAVAPWWVARKAGAAAVAVPWALGYAVGTIYRSTAGLVAMVVPGILAGGAVGLMIGIMDHDVEEAVPVNAIAGGVIAVVIGLFFKLREKRPCRAAMMCRAGQPAHS